MRVQLVGGHEYLPVLALALPRSHALVADHDLAVHSHHAGHLRERPPLVRKQVQAAEVVDGIEEPVVERQVSGIPDEEADGAAGAVEETGLTHSLAADGQHARREILYVELALVPET